MAVLSSRMLFFVLVLFSALCIDLSSASQAEDEAEGEEDVNVEDVAAAEDAAGETQPDYPEDDAGKKNLHSDADTTIMFIRPTVFPESDSASSVELPAGQVVEFLVGLTNRGDDTQLLIIETLDASFRYPMDFTYHIQNFSAIAYDKSVVGGQEASVLYSFIPADAFAGRPIGLTINLNYKDDQGNFYVDPVFNETVQIVEFNEGFDTEVFFMYVFMAAGTLLLAFLVYSFVGSKGKGKKKNISKKPVETGTSSDDVDYEWIPRSAALPAPGSNKTSPRQRKSKRNAAVGASDTD